MQEPRHSEPRHSSLPDSSESDDAWLSPSGSLLDAGVLPDAGALLDAGASFDAGAWLIGKMYGKENLVLVQRWQLSAYITLRMQSVQQLGWSGETK